MSQTFQFSPMKEVDDKLLGRGSVRKSLELRPRKHLKIMVSSVRKVGSFHKYLERLRKAGVRVPTKVEASIRECMRG